MATRRGGIKRTARKRRRKRKRPMMRGGAHFRYKPRLVDKIGEGISMFLAGPAPTWTTVATKLGSQAFKGVKDNVDYYLHH